MQHALKIIIHKRLSHLRFGCLISEGESFLLTGGASNPYVSTRYNITGWVKDLNSLNTGRTRHGCSRYTNKEGVKVGELKVLNINIKNVFQVNIVCGGRDATETFLSSCEVNIDGEDSWSITNAPLPVGIYGLRGATLDNRVLMTGENIHTLELDSTMSQS